MTKIMTSLYALLDSALADLKTAREVKVFPSDREIYNAFVKEFEGEVKGISMAIEIVKKEAN
tara:strand:- start:9 stop:194 length:186 start_codon:yes stop_codon:yes gene_type:complete